MISAFDDFPVHQASEPVRHPVTSDRNFYDRYYFNLYDVEASTFAIFGLGQYPNLGVQDAFVSVRRGDTQYVVRASRELGDRADLSVGPFRVEVLEPLKRVRFVCEPTEHTVAMDCTFEGVVAPHEEPRQFRRVAERVFFDTCRFAQTGRWSGTLSVAGQELAVEPGRWWGFRDRSWGVRPVGEPDPPGIAATHPFQMYWNYVPVQFDDASLFYIAEEEASGRRSMEDATLVPHGGEPVFIGRPEHAWSFEPGTRRITSGTVTFGGTRTLKVEVLLPMFIGLGTGYSRDPEWIHGMYQGPLKVEGRTFDLTDPDVVGSQFFSVVDTVARFDLDGETGYGMLEYFLLGPHEPSGLKDYMDVVGG